MLKAQIGSKPGQYEHDQSAADHDTEGGERDQHWRPVPRRKIGESDFLGCQTHAADDASQNRDLDFVPIRFGRRIWNPDQHLARWLLIMPAALDRRKLRGLVVVDVV